MNFREEFEQALPGEQPRYTGWERFNEAMARLQQDPVFYNRVYVTLRVLGVGSPEERADVACTLHALDVIEAAEVMQHVRRPLRLNDGPTVRGERFR